MNNATAVIVAIQAPEKAKSRLANALIPYHRRTLVTAMLTDFLGALRSVHSGPVIIVTDSDSYQDIASQSDAIIVEDSGSGFNQAAIAGIEFAASHTGADSILIFPGDIPQANSNDISDLIASLQASPENTVTLVASQDGGTTALGLHIPTTYKTQFGPESALKHREQATLLRMGINEMILPSLEIDIDTIADLEQVKNIVGKHTVSALEIILFEKHLAERRSFRGLQGPPLTQEEIESLIRLGLKAPAPHHSTPWRFVVVSSESRPILAGEMGAKWKQDLLGDGLPEAQINKALANSSARILSAPTLLLGCLVQEGLNTYADSERASAEWGLAQHSIGAALENILLAAHVRNYGAYWISAPLYAGDKVRAALRLEYEWIPQALIALGRKNSDYKPFNRPELDINEYLIWRK